MQLMVWICSVIRVREVLVLQVWVSSGVVIVHNANEATIRCDIQLILY